MPYVALFKEHVAVGQNYDCSGDNYDNCFHAFSILSHGNFLLHKVYEKMEDYACEHASAVFNVNPGCQKSHRYYGNKKIKHVQNIHFPDFIVIGSGNPEKWKMPQSPDKSKNN